MSNTITDYTGQIKPGSLDDEFDPMEYVPEMVDIVLCAYKNNSKWPDALKEVKSIMNSEVSEYFTDPVIFAMWLSIDRYVGGF